MAKFRKKPVGSEAWQWNADIHTDGIAYIAESYRVPAKRGGRVEYTGGDAPKLGTITGSYAAHLLIRLDGQKHSRPYHPTWELRYLPAGGE